MEVVNQKICGWQMSFGTWVSSVMVMSEVVMLELNFGRSGGRPCRVEKVGEWSSYRRRAEVALSGGEVKEIWCCL